MSIQVNDNTEEVLNEAKEKIKTALEACGLAAEGFAVQNIATQEAVDTGFLRNSITHCVHGESFSKTSYSDDAGKQTGSYGGTIGAEDDHTVSIGTNVKYAPYIELGTSKNGGPRPYLKPAMADHMSEYKQILEQYLKG